MWLHAQTLQDKNENFSFLEVTCHAWYLIIKVNYDNVNKSNSNDNSNQNTEKLVLYFSPAEFP